MITKNKLPSKMPKHISAMFKAAGLPAIDETLSQQEAFQDGLMDWQASTLRRIRAGLNFLRSSSLGEHGFISSEARRLGIGTTTIYRLMDAATVFLSASPSNCPALGQLEFSKIHALRKINEDEIDAFLTGSRIRGVTFDEALDLSARELDQRFRENADQIQSLKNETATKQAKIKKLELELKQERNKHLTDEATQHLPEFVTELRTESFICTEKARLALDDLATMFNEHKRRYNSRDQELVDNWNIASAAVYHSVAAITAQAEALIQNMEQHLGDEVIGRPKGEYLFSEAEGIEAIRRRDLITQIHVANQTARKATGKSKKRSTRK